MLSKIALGLLMVGGLNWGLVGLLNFDLVAFIFGSQQNMFARIVYVVIGLSALLAAPLLFAPQTDSNMKSGGM